MRAGGKQLLFFLTPLDLSIVIESIEDSAEIVYYKMGLFPLPTTSAISSLVRNSELGYLTKGDWNHSPSYLITTPDAEIVTREIILKKGGYSYAVDQEENPDTVIFKPSGVFTEGILIAGALGTLSNTAYSLKSFKAFSKIIKQYTSKIGLFYVGADAREKLKLNWRLIVNSSSPKEYDLTLNEA